MSTLITNNVLDLDGNVLLAKGQAAKYVESLQDLLTANMESHKVVNVLNYHTGLEGGGGLFYWDATGNATEHNGGTVVSPLAAFPTDWNNQTQLTTWFDGSVLVGTGVWRRQYDGAVYVDWFGAKGVDNNTNTPDSSTSFRKCFSYVQEKHTTSHNNPNAIYSANRGVVAFSSKTYYASTDNPFGVSFLTFPIIPTTFSVEGNGAVVIWRPPSVDSVLFKNMSGVYNFNISNITFTVLPPNGDLSINSTGYFLTTNGSEDSSLGFSSQSRNFMFTDVSLTGYDTEWKSAFKLAGWSHDDLASVRGMVAWCADCFFDVTNPEAVAWSFIDCDVLVREVGANIFHIRGQNNTSNNWSGGIQILGGNYTLLNEDQTFIKISSTNAGELFCSTRVESYAKVTWFDLTSGKVVVDIPNFSAARAHPESVLYINRKKATLVLRNSNNVGWVGNGTINTPNVYIPAFYTNDYDSIVGAAGAHTALILDNCLGSPIKLQFMDYATWTPITYKEVLDSDRRFANYIFKNSGVYPNNISYGLQPKNGQIKEYTLRVGTHAAQSRWYISGGEFSLPPYAFISSVLINVGAIPANYTKVGIFNSANRTTPLAEVNLNPGSDTYKTELIPSNKIGISCPAEAYTFTLIFGIYDNTTSSWIFSNITIPGWVDLTYRSISSYQEYSDDGTIKVV